MSTATAALAKKSIKARFCNTKADLTKLREELRQRCKLRMKEKREELVNQRRFGISSDDDVQEKLKEIFHEELNDLAAAENVPEITDLIKKVIDNKETSEPLTEEAKVIVEEFNKLKEEAKSTLEKEES